MHTQPLSKPRRRWNDVRRKEHGSDLAKRVLARRGTPAIAVLHDMTSTTASKHQTAFTWERTLRHTTAVPHLQGCEVNGLTITVCTAMSTPPPLPPPFLLQPATVKPAQTRSTTHLPNSRLEPSALDMCARTPDLDNLSHPECGRQVRRVHRPPKPVSNDPLVPVAIPTGIVDFVPFVFRVTFPGVRRYRTGKEKCGIGYLRNLRQSPRRFTGARCT